MTNPLERLRSLVPPPSGGGGRRDWAAVERRLGRALPADYKDFVDAYGGGQLDRHVGLLVPAPSRPGSELVSYNDGYFDDLTNLWEITENRPPELDVDDLRLVVWADTIDADTLNWLVLPGEPPERWPVAVLDADLGDCELYPMTCTEFLAGLVSGEIDSGIITHHLKADGHVFYPYPVATPR
jgi:hypothetical protein